MRILFIGNNFPPEVNALATRLYEHARTWTSEGREVVVLTDVPNFPEGEVYEGYTNTYSEETMDGIEVVRVPLYITRNEGTIKRILSFISFMLSSIWYSRRIKGSFDVVVASSPQFFAAIGGYVISKMKGARFVLEIRDLWPESIVAVGAMSRNLIIRFFEQIEHFLYRKADHIVVVTNTFKRVIAGKGIDAKKISVLKNGADLTRYEQPLNEQTLNQLLKTHDLEGKFIASYIGTIGMAHRVDVLLDAAEKCTRDDVVFVIVGTGANRKALEERLAERPLPNVRLIDKQPKSLVLYWLALSNASIVHLKASPLFKTVIPSKIFEAMAMRIPILLGVDGETREIIEEAEAGLFFTPEDSDALLESALKLRDDPSLCTQLGLNGQAYVRHYHDREKIARRYWKLLEALNGGVVSEDVEPRETMDAY